MEVVLQLAPATITGILYAVRAHHLAGTPRAVPGWRRACLPGGLGLIVLTLTPPGALNLYLWHVPYLQDAAVNHAVVHAVAHFGFVAFGFNMWMALLGPLPKPAWFGNLARLFYIIAVRMTGAILGNVFVFGGQVFFKVYAAGERAHGISPGADQNAAGAVMMVEGSILTLLLFGWLFARAAREGEERQELLDLAAARGVELSAERAGRAVAAGRGAELRRRIESGSSPSGSPT